MSIKIDDSLIYEILKFVANSPNKTTTLRKIIDNTPLTDYDEGNTVISEISRMGLLTGGFKGDDIIVTLDQSGRGQLFLDNYSHVLRLTSKQKWIERFWGYIFGVLTGFTIAALVFFLGFS